MPEPTVESSMDAGSAFAALDAAGDADADYLLSDSLGTDPASIDPAIKLACRQLADAGLQAESIAPRTGLTPLAQNAVAAGYVVGRQRLGRRGNRGSVGGDLEQRAQSLLQIERGYDPVRLRAAMGPAVESIQTELTARTAVAAGTTAPAPTARRLAYIGFAAGFALAAAEFDLAHRGATVTSGDR